MARYLARYPTRRNGGIVPLENPGLIVDLALGLAAGGGAGYVTGWLFPLSAADWAAASEGRFTLRTALLVGSTFALPAAATVLLSPAAGVGAFAGEVIGHRLAPRRPIITVRATQVR